MAGFRKTGEEELHRGHVVRLVRASFLSPDGESFERDVVHTPGAVGVVPIAGRGADAVVLLVRQFRAPIERDMLEIPAGLRDVVGEPADVTAARELEEEVGMRPGRLEPLGAFYSSAGFTDMRVELFLGLDLEPTARATHGPEESHMVVEEIPLAQVPALLADGEVLDAKTIIGLRAALDRLGSG